LSETLTEVENGFVGVAVENEALEFLANFVYFVGVHLLLVDDESSQLGSRGDR